MLWGECFPHPIPVLTSSRQFSKHLPAPGKHKIKLIKGPFAFCSDQQHQLWSIKIVGPPKFTFPYQLAVEVTTRNHSRYKPMWSSSCWMWLPMISLVTTISFSPHMLAWPITTLPGPSLMTRAAQSPPQVPAERSRLIPACLAAGTCAQGAMWCAGAGRQPQGHGRRGGIWV